MFGKLGIRICFGLCARQTGTTCRAGLDIRIFITWITPIITQLLLKRDWVCGFHEGLIKHGKLKES